MKRLREKIEVEDKTQKDLRNELRDMEAPLTEIITQVTTYQEEVGVIIISLTV